MEFLDSGPDAAGHAGMAPERANLSQRRVCLGIVTGAHGVRGAVKLKSFAQEPADIAGYGPLEDESGATHYTVRLVGNAKGVLIALLSGIDDRDRAEALRGARLYLRREALPPTGEDEYYHADLIGLATLDIRGNRVGEVRAVHDFGAGDTLEITRPAGQPIMVPFTRAAVPVVDFAGGHIVIDPPTGLVAEPPTRRARAKAPA
ncbi:MAG: ribosome maturation factor RimM [Stellaceae bacterium]